MQDGIADTSSMKEVVKTVKIKRERIELNPIVYKSYKVNTTGQNSNCVQSDHM